MAADALRECPMASGFGFADHVIIIIIFIARPWTVIDLKPLRNNRAKQLLS